MPVCACVSYFLWIFSSPVNRWKGTQESSFCHSKVNTSFFLYSSGLSLSLKDPAATDVISPSSHLILRLDVWWLCWLVSDLTGLGVSVEDLWSWTSEGHCLSQCLRISSYATRKETTLPHDETTVATTTTAAKRFPSSNKLGRLPASACACVSECIRVCARLWCITHTHTASHQLVSGAFLFSKSTCLFTGCLPFLLFILDLFKAKNFSNCSSSHFSSFSKQLNNQVRSHEHRVIAADHRICVGFSLLKLLLNKRTTCGIERSASVEWSSWRVLFDCLKKIAWLTAL